MAGSLGSQSEPTKLVFLRGTACGQEAIGSAETDEEGSFSISSMSRYFRVLSY